MTLSKIFYPLEVHMFNSGGRVLGLSAGEVARLPPPLHGRALVDHPGAGLT